MPLSRDENGTWTFEQDDGDKDVVAHSHASYLEALPRYLTALDPAFEQARAKSEFNFLWSIFGFRGMSDAGWNPYETTVRALEVIRKAYSSMESEVAAHLALWVYGHAVEASEPYEFLANLIDVSVGGRFNMARFPPHPSGRPLSPQTKIERLEKLAQAANMPEVVTPMKEAWNRDLRNAIFHADYTIHGLEVRTIRPTRVYDFEEHMTLVNRALASHEAMTILRKYHIGSYTEPTRIPADPEFTNTPNEDAIVMVRRGHGAIGIRDGWTVQELAKGYIPYHVGRFTLAELTMMRADATIALFPAIEDQEKPA